MVDAINSGTDFSVRPAQLAVEEEQGAFPAEVNKLQIKAAEDEGKSAIQKEFETAVHEGDLETIERIIREKPDGFDINAVDSRGRTVLFYVHETWTTGRARIVEALIKGGIDLSILDNDGLSALQFISRELEDYVLVVQGSPRQDARARLIQFIDYLKKEMAQALREAVHERDENTAISLIKGGADPKAEIDADPGESGGITLLTFAAAHKMSDTVKAILDAIPEEQREDFVNQQDLNGNTAYHAAHWSGDKKSQSYLSDAGADGKIKNKSGEKPGNMKAEKDGQPKVEKRDNPFASLPPSDFGVSRDRIILEINSEHSYKLEFYDEHTGKWVEFKTIPGGSGPQLIYLPEAAQDTFKFRFTDTTTGNVYEQSDFKTAVGDLFDHPGKIAYSLSDVEGDGGNKDSSILMGIGLTDKDVQHLRDERYKDYDAALSLLEDLPDAEDMVKATNAANEKFFAYLSGFGDGTDERILFNLYRALGIAQGSDMEGRADIKAIQSDIQKILTDNPEIGEKLSEFQDETISKLFKDKGGLSAEQIREKLLADDMVEEILQMPEHLRMEFLQQITGSIAALDPELGRETNRDLLEKILLPKDPDAALAARDEDDVSVSTEAILEFIVNAGRIGVGSWAEIGQPLAQLTTEERTEAAKAIAKYVKGGGKVGELAKDGALAELALDGRIKNAIGRFFKNAAESGLVPGLVSILSIFAIVQDFKGERQTDSSAANVLNTLGDVMLFAAPLPGVADALNKMGFNKQNLSKIWRTMSLFNIANQGGYAAAFRGNDIALQDLSSAITAIYEGKAPKDVQRIMDVLKEYESIVDALGGANNKVGLRRLAEHIATSMQAPNFDADTFVKNLIDSRVSGPNFLGSLLSEDGALRSKTKAIAELQSALNDIGRAGQDISVDQIEEILNRRPELRQALGENQKLTLRKIAVEIHSWVSTGDFDAKTYMELSGKHSKIESALSDLSVELYTDPERVAEALRADEGIVNLVGEDGITLLANRISEMAKQGRFDLRTFLKDANVLTGEGTDALSEVFMGLGGAYHFASMPPDEKLEYFSNLYTEWQLSIEEGGDHHNFVDYLRDTGEEGAADAFEEYFENAEDIPDFFFEQDFIPIVDMDHLPPEILGPGSADFVAGLSKEEQAELSRQLGTIMGEGIVKDAGQIPFSKMSSWGKFVAGAGMFLNVASVIYAIGGLISTADLAKQGKTIPAAFTGIGAGAFGLWGITGALEMGVGAALGMAPAALAVMPWLGFAFGVVSMGALIGNFIYSSLPSTQLAEKRDFLSEGVGNGENYLIVAPHDDDSLPDEIRDIDGERGIRPFVPNERPNEKMRRPPGDNRSAKEIIEDNPLLANLSAIDKEFLKYGYAERYAKDQFGRDFEVTFHGIGDFEKDADAAYRAEQVLYHIENYDQAGNKITDSKDIGNNKIDGWTRANRNDPRSEAKPHTEAGRFQDFIKYGWGTLKGPVEVTYDPLTNGSQSDSEWKTIILRDGYSLSTLMDHYFRKDFSKYPDDLKELIIEKIDEYLDTEENRKSFLQSLKEGTLTRDQVKRMLDDGMFEEDDDNELAHTVLDWLDLGDGLKIVKRGMEAIPMRA